MKSLKELEKIAEDYKFAGYKKLQGYGLYRYKEPYYTIEDYKSDLFLYLFKDGSFKKLDENKSKLKTYMNNYILRKLNRELVGKSDLFTRKVMHSEKFEPVDLTSFNRPLKNTNTYLEEIIPAEVQNKSNEVKFWTDCLKYIGEQSLDYKFKNIEYDDETKLILLADIENTVKFTENVNAIYNKFIKRRLQRMLKNLGYNKIEDLPVSKMEVL